MAPSCPRTRASRGSRAQRSSPAVISRKIASDLLDHRQRSLSATSALQTFDGQPDQKRQQHHGEERFRERPRSHRQTFDQQRQLQGRNTTVPTVATRMKAPAEDMSPRALLTIKGKNGARSGAMLIREVRLRGGSDSGMIFVSSSQATAEPRPDDPSPRSGSTARILGS